MEHVHTSRQREQHLADAMAAVTAAAATEQAERQRHLAEASTVTEVGRLILRGTRCSDLGERRRLAARATVMLGEHEARWPDLPGGLARPLHEAIEALRLAAIPACECCGAMAEDGADGPPKCLTCYQQERSAHV